MVDAQSMLQLVSLCPYPAYFCKKLVIRFQAFTGPKAYPKASCTGYIETSSHVVFTPFPSKVIHLDQVEAAAQDTQQELGGLDIMDLITAMLIMRHFNAVLDLATQHTPFRRTIGGVELEEFWGWAQQIAIKSVAITTHHRF